MSALKKQRIDLRLNEDDKHMIEEAAAITNQSYREKIPDVDLPDPDDRYCI